MRLKNLALLMGFACLLVAGCRNDSEDNGNKNNNNNVGGNPDAGDGQVVACATMDARGERGPTACTNGCDDDGDGFQDCDDSECKGVGSCPGVGGQDCSNAMQVADGGENTPALCGDGCDNDGDGFTDCLDFACSGVGTCFAENSNDTCSDGIDNDNNGFTDCEDNSCRFCVQGDTMDCRKLIVCAGEVTNRACSDGADNDGDGKNDCADPDCNAEHIVVCDGQNLKNPLPAENTWQGLIDAQCDSANSDGDNDSDTFADCEDFDCQIWSPTKCPVSRENTLAKCDDGIDNDYDGNVDCDDTECQNLGEANNVCDGDSKIDEGDRTPADTLCSDNQDDDGADGFVDCADFSCQYDPSVTVCTMYENTDARCSDGIDQDGDGNIDCKDFDCQRASGVTVCEVRENCGDGIDNDGNGWVDCDDFSCLRCDDDGCDNALACSVIKADP